MKLAFSLAQLAGSFLKTLAMACRMGSGTCAQNVEKSGCGEKRTLNVAAAAGPGKRARRIRRPVSCQRWTSATVSRRRRPLCIVITGGGGRGPRYLRRGGSVTDAHTPRVLGRRRPHHSPVGGVRPVSCRPDHRRGRLGRRASKNSTKKRHSGTARTDSFLLLQTIGRVTRRRRPQYVQNGDTYDRREKKKIIKMYNNV